MRKFDLSLRSSRSSYFATFRHQLTILSKTDALDEEKWLNMLGTFVKDWFRYESHFVHGRDSLVDILKERGLLSESDFFFQAEDGIRDVAVTGVQTCALPICEHDRAHGFCTRVLAAADLGFAHDLRAADRLDRGFATFGDEFGLFRFDARQPFKVAAQIGRASCRERV